MKLGSLFDGSGGFPLAGLLCGIEPIWASEIEPFPIRVTSKKIPQMKHLGDITTIHGDRIQPVDIITFGSPCQDISLAGTRTGLNGKRSGLFFEAIRIVKEMRRKTNDQYPRFIVWENVVGAFSSNHGNDFEEVLDEIISIKEGIPKVPETENGKWPRADMLLADGFSIAWRVFDAQYWGVPQRRKRIFLVADLNGSSAGEVLFKSESSTGYSAKMFKPKQNPACNSESRPSKAGTNQITVPIENHPNDSRLKLEKDDICSTLTSRMGTGGNNTPLVLEIYSSSKADYFTRFSKDIAGALVATDFKDPPIVCLETRIRRLTPSECCRLQGFPDGWCSALETETPNEDEIDFWKSVFSATGKIKSSNQIISWLKNPYSESAEYKMWGNGIALPCALFVLSGIVWANSKESPCNSHPSE